MVSHAEVASLAVYPALALASEARESKINQVDLGPAGPVRAQCYTTEFSSSIRLSPTDGTAPGLPHTYVVGLTSALGPVATGSLGCSLTAKPPSGGLTCPSERARGGLRI